MQITCCKPGCGRELVKQILHGRNVLNIDQKQFVYLEHIIKGRTKECRECGGCCYVRMRDYNAFVAADEGYGLCSRCGGTCVLKIKEEGCKQYSKRKLRCKELFGDYNIPKGRIWSCPEHGTNPIFDECK
jgi:hypothetical protein